MAFEPVARAAEPPGGGVEQLAGGGGGQFRDTRAGIAAGSPAAEQAQVGVVRGLRHLGRGDVQQRDPGTGQRQEPRRVHAGPPGSLSS